MRSSSLTNSSSTGFALAWKASMRFAYRVLPRAKRQECLPLRWPGTRPRERGGRSSRRELENWGHLPGCEHRSPFRLGFRALSERPRDAGGRPRLCKSERRDIPPSRTAGCNRTLHPDDLSGAGRTDPRAGHIPSRLLGIGKREIRGHWTDLSSAVLPAPLLAAALSGG